jgi:glycosyltransferase involved in cell wall biosynthesis
MFVRQFVPNRSLIKFSLSSALRERFRRMQIFYDGKIYVDQMAGGINRYFANLISRLPKDYYPTITKIDHTTSQYPEHPNLRSLSCKRFRPHRLSLPLEKLYFQHLISKQKFDLIHPTYYSLLTRQEVSNYSCPVVLTVHDMIHERFPKLFDPNDPTVEAKRKAILSAQQILCISENTKKDLLEQYPIAEEKITITYLGSELDISLSYGAEIVPSQPYFLYVGSRYKYKNFDGMLAAFAKVASEKPEVRLCIVGAPFNSEERQWIADLHLGDHIDHYQYANDHHLAKLYRCSVAFVYPSRYEGFGIPPLEAMACGTVAIAANTSSIPEVVGDAGLLFEPDTPGDLTDIMLLLLDHPVERDRFIAKGFERAKDFSWDKTAAQTMAVYQSVIS